MQQENIKTLTAKNNVTELPDKSIKFLASSIYEQLIKCGCNSKDVMRISSEIISFLTEDITDRKIA